jgi:hypothetical protein
MPSDTDLAYLRAGAASVSRIGMRTKSAIGAPVNAEGSRRRVHIA